MHGIVLADTNGITLALPFLRHKLHQTLIRRKSSKEHWNKVNYDNG